VGGVKIPYMISIVNTKKMQGSVTYKEVVLLIDMGVNIAIIRGPPILWYSILLENRF